MTDQWYFLEKDQRKGPVTGDELLALIQRGDVSCDQLVWHGSLHDWTPAEKVIDRLAPEQKAASVQPPPPPPAQAGESIADGNGDPGSGAMRSHNGVLIFVLGLVSLLAAWPMGPVPWLWGNRDLKLMKSGQMDSQGESLTQAGRICGMIASIPLLFGLFLILATIVVYLM